ncbi:PREDICTED: mastermind-like domain-containing protein 1 [Myotis davidii]|uniref:Mastermind-like domain-containing protein 1 n=1 Tax=Myotis davidii TaxID=225400 RepID=L5MIR5_MYODS|nr:PREDICTED: mastermind-like domain-containing protein 1 [Myotis davidii]XP_015416656.1 PREDICTED: mastermind-like domain-containing protein 1 [Myotis davidii]ELK38170.1 Mastermind-like domain-containing protein 1 [Myotis davidii]
MDDWKTRIVIKSMLPHITMVGNRQEPRKLQESPQGPIKRRQEGDNFQFPGMADGGYPNKSKRLCLEDVTLSMGPGAHSSMPCTELQVPPLTMNPSSSAMGAVGHSLLLENNSMNGSIMDSPFVLPPNAEMGLKGPTLPYYDKTNSMIAVEQDQELQDLLEELTEIQDRSSNELDLEKILGSKPEEPPVLDHSQVTLGTTRKPSAQMSHLESLGSSKEFASGCSQVTGVSLQIPPSSAGIGYAMPSTSKQMVTPSSATTQAKSQVQAMLPVALPPLPVPQWHHAHQLKVLAASKQGSATKQQGPTSNWSSLTSPGLSPPYRPVPSPHPPPPFSPQSLMVSCMSSSNLQGSTLQGSPNALLSSMASSNNAALGPTMSYAPEKLASPSLNQQPQFSPQSSILANLVSSTIKSPQGHLMSALPTSNPGPSPPYRPEKLSSPGLPQQSFTPQCSLIRSLTPSSNPLSQQQQHQQTNAIFKPMATNSPKTLSMIMQQGLASSRPGAPEPFNFGNTKPLSHFVSEPGPQKMPSMPATSRQPSLLHYLQQPMLTQASSATASSTATATLQLQQQQPDRSSFLLQQMMQQPQRFQRSAASESMPSLPRQQEKQRSGLMAMTPEQQSAYIAQQMNQFQAVQEQVTSKRSRTKASPPSSQHMMLPRAELLQNNLSPGMIPPSRHQSHGGMILPTPGKKQGIFNSSPLFPISSCSGQNPLGSLGSVCQYTQMPKAYPSGVLLPRFCPSPLGSQPLSPHQLRQPSVPRMSTLFNNATWVAAATANPEVSREPLPSQVDNSAQQQFNSNSIFAKAPVRSSPIAPACPSQQAVVPPNQGTPGDRPGQKVNATLANPSLSLRQSPEQCPVPVLNTKSPQQGIDSFGPMSPIQAIEPPPSYVAAAAAAAAASAITASQSPGPFNRMGPLTELPPNDFLPQPQPPLNDLISPPDCNEVDFIEALLKGPSTSPDEDWVCNLRLIDDILEEQHAAAQNAAAQNDSQVTQNSQDGIPKVDITLGSGVNP